MKNLEQREKPELIAIIQHMLRQEPELQWLLMSPLPTASSRKSSVDPEVYRQQVLAAMAAGENQRKRKRGEVERRLTAIKSIADEFAARENYAAALSIYEVLVGNTTPGERRVIASWARDALTHKAAWISSQRYEALLAALERGKR